MRVESNKNNFEKKNETSNYKTEKTLFDSTPSLKTPVSPNPAPATGAFSKILEEARQANSRADDKLSAGKSETSDAKSSKSDDEKEIDRKNEHREELKNKNRRNGEGGSENDEDSNPYANGFFTTGKRLNSELSAPQARSILHIADLEKIVAVLRSEKLSESKQILIALKHSILEGLQIRLTLDENGNLKAEFLASNKEIKRQLKKRESELLEILKKRSSKFTQIEILLLQ